MLARISSAEYAEWNQYFLILAEEAEMRAAGTPQTNPDAWEEV